MDLHIVIPQERCEGSCDYQQGTTILPCHWLSVWLPTQPALRVSVHTMLLLRATSLNVYSLVIINRFNQSQLSH